ncbi:MAG: transglutaminase domain-containing protein [Lachnospiraceae bacterium]|nr:transglutaminase domain-containing protein [Lachnospiraceae bacterium]
MKQENKTSFAGFHTHSGYMLSILLLIFLLCLGTAVGCGKESGNGTITPTSGISPSKNAPSDVAPNPTDPASTTPTEPVSATPTVSAPATPTTTPTTAIDISTLGYDTYSRNDLYRIPVLEPEDQRIVKDSRFAGEYALLLFAPANDPEKEPSDTDPEASGTTTDADSAAASGADTDSAAASGTNSDANSTADTTLVLLRPTTNTDQYRLTPEFTVRSIGMLADGTVLLEESGTGIIHIYDNTLSEIRTIPKQAKRSKTLGYGEDGTIWTMDIAQSKILATDLQGEQKGEYSCAKGQTPSEYVGQHGNRECFKLSSGDEDSSPTYLYISLPDGDITVRSGDDPDLGDTWARDSVLSVGKWDLQFSASMWFLHVPGYSREGVIFPKSEVYEKAMLIQDNLLCSNDRHWSGDDIIGRTYRLYDLESRQVSGSLPDEELPNCDTLTAKGIVGGSILFTITYETGGEDLLLWQAGTSMSPFTGFCDLKKDDLTTVLSDTIAMLKEQYGIIITPDRADNGQLLPLGKSLAQLEFADSFLLIAKNDPDILKRSSDNTIRPENMNNNSEGHYTFNPHVVSPFFDKDNEEARGLFFALIDGLRAGEDSFPCPDNQTLDRCGNRLNQLIRYCFPMALEYAYCDYGENGRAKIIYRTGRETYQTKEQAFEEKICAILNDVLEDDYTDMEKALALYEFMTEYCDYDYSKKDDLLDGERGIYQSAYRVLLEKKGVCWEIASLYAYLLMQCGIGAEVVSCESIDKEEPGHAWVYLELDGKGYLIDPTWGLTYDRLPDLEFFLFTDELRESRDGFLVEAAQIIGYKAYESREKFSFDAVDTLYSALWNGWYLGFDKEAGCIYYFDRDCKIQRFDYK